MIRCQAAISIKIVTYLFVSVALICLFLCLKKIILPNICILYCLFLLNSILFLKPCFDSANKFVILFAEVFSNFMFSVVFVTFSKKNSLLFHHQKFADNILNAICAILNLKFNFYKYL